MKQYFYPASFYTAEEGGSCVSFPDLPECLTKGDSMNEAYKMAAEALGLALTDRNLNQEPLPGSSRSIDHQNILPLNSCLNGQSKKLNKKRRRWDSNPRTGYEPVNAFRVRRVTTTSLHLQKY